MCCSQLSHSSWLRRELPAGPGPLLCGRAARRAGGVGTWRAVRTSSPGRGPLSCAPSSAQTWRGSAGVRLADSLWRQGRCAKAGNHVQRTMCAMGGTVARVQDRPAQSKGRGRVSQSGALLCFWFLIHCYNRPTTATIRGGVNAYTHMIFSLGSGFASVSYPPATAYAAPSVLAFLRPRTCERGSSGQGEPTSVTRACGGCGGCGSKALHAWRAAAAAAAAAGRRGAGGGAPSWHGSSSPCAACGPWSWPCPYQTAQHKVVR